MNTWHERREWIDDALRAWVDQIDDGAANGLLELKKSIEYTLVRGGKRFRPVLSLLIAEVFGVSPRRVLPWAAAVEMIHTYSLIHDDLPCMDDDDERRGEPTNHKVFGESTALLAGDALLTEAFGLLPSAYMDEPALAAGLVRLLAEAAGLRGMVGGQAIDLKSQEQKLELEELLLMHEMKTGALIRAACEGTAFVCGLPEDTRRSCREFGSLLGFAFQLKDDVLDSSAEIEKGSLAAHLGLQQTEQRLLQVSQNARQVLARMDLGKSALADLVQMNLDRTQ
jgi:geranylgeranyl diphosphate synthase type II